PVLAPEDGSYVERALPDAQAISLQSGGPPPMADVQWRTRTVGDVLVFGVTPPFVVVQDYVFAAGGPFTDVDQRQRRLVAVLGFDVADKLFGAPELAIGSPIRVRGAQLTIKGVIAKKGTVLGQSWDGFVMLPLTTFEALYGRRQTTVISVKMPAAAGHATPVPRGVGHPRAARRHRGSPRRQRPGRARPSRVPPARPRDRMVGRRRARPRHQRGHRVRRLPRAPGGTPQSDRSVARRISMALHSIREGWLIAVDQLRANKLRSGLTILGVVIGIATVMAMASIVAGFREQIVNTLEVVGPT